MRRALLESVLRLQCSEGILADLQAHAGQLYGRDLEEYGSVLELYGSSRMLLAVLPRELLQRVRGTTRLYMFASREMQFVDLYMYRSVPPSGAAQTHS